MIGSISIEKCPIDVSIGVYEHEKNKKQVIIIDIILKVDCTKCISSDDLADAFDYDKVIELCRYIASLRHYHLIETLASALMHALDQTFSPLGIKIILKKTIPFATAAITLQKGDI